jgi:hypothetical protein
MMGGNNLKNFITIPIGLGQNQHNNVHHDWRLLCNMWGNGGWKYNAAKEIVSSLEHPAAQAGLKLPTYDQKIKELLGSQLDLYHFTYTNPGDKGSNQFSGVVASSGIDGLPKPAEYVLKEIYNDVFGQPYGGGGTTGGNSNSIDRSKFLNMALSATQELMGSSRLGVKDKQTLEQYQTVVSSIKTDLENAANNGGGNSGGSNSGGPDITIASDILDIQGITNAPNASHSKAIEYLDIFRKLIVAGIMNGQDKTIVNIGNLTPLRENLAGSMSPDQLLCTDNHVDAHDSPSFQHINDPLTKNANQLDFTRGIMRHIVFPLANLLNSYDLLDSGCIYYSSTYDQTNKHSLGLGKEDTSMGIQKMIIGKLNGAFSGGKVFDLRKTHASGRTGHFVDSIIAASFFQSFGISKNQYSLHPMGGYGSYPSTNHYGGSNDNENDHGSDDTNIIDTQAGMKAEDPFPNV